MRPDCSALSVSLSTEILFLMKEGFIQKYNIKY